MTETLEPKIYNVDRYVISSVIHKPKGKGPFPSVILLPGFTGYKDESHIISIAEYLAENSYLTIRFDPTGYGKSEGTVEEDYRVSTYLNDIDTVATYLKHQDMVNQNAIGLWGGSMGGMLAIIYAAEYSFIKAVCAVSPCTHIGSSLWLKELADEWEKNDKAEVELLDGSKISVPGAFYRDARKYSALTSVKELKQPILVLVGKADDVVSPQDSQQIFSAANEPKKIIEIEGMGHEYADKPQQIKEINTAVKEFFDTYLK